MQNVYCRTPLWKATRTLAAVAQGSAPAELVIRNATLVNVCTGELQEHTDVACAMGRIAYVGPDASHCIGPDTDVTDAGGAYLEPGLLDGHIHIESSMMTPRNFARAVLPHGTTGVYHDPHEICNVLGPRGVEFMMEDAAATPLKAMLTMPSCVPAVPGFEDTGGFVGPAEVAASMADGRTVGLGEMMNYPGILSGSDHAHDIVGETLKAGKTVTGHYSVPETDRGLNAYIASGIRCCHESTRAEDALAKMRLGMYAMLREGSGWRDLHEVIRSVTEHRVDRRFAVLITDDAHPHTLMEEGHLDRLLRRAVQEGLDPVSAIQMVTINCAQCFQMDHELGSVTPGKCADMVLFADLKDFVVQKVFVDGVLVARDGALTAPIPEGDCPDWARSTVRLSPVKPEDFRFAAPSDAPQRVRAIGVMGGKVPDVERIVTLTPRDGALGADPAQDILKAVVFERHKGTGTRGMGFVHGFGISGGAMASTVAHDAHNLLVVGSNDADMALAANTLIASQGGMCVVKDGKVLGHIPLPIAGLMGEGAPEEMAALADALGRAWTGIGCTLPSPFMTMALIPLACIPDLRLTNRGLVDCRTYTMTSVLADEA